MSPERVVVREIPYEVEVVKEVPVPVERVVYKVRLPGVRWIDIKEQARASVSMRLLDAKSGFWHCSSILVFCGCGERVHKSNAQAYAEPMHGP